MTTWRNDTPLFDNLPALLNELEELILNAAQQGPQGIPGFANDGEDGMFIPGGQGAPGVDGSQGREGVPGFSNDGDDGLFGVPGNTGATGADGVQGREGIPGFSNDGEDGMFGIPIPQSIDPALVLMTADSKMWAEDNDLRLVNDIILPGASELFWLDPTEMSITGPVAVDVMYIPNGYYRLHYSELILDGLNEAIIDGTGELVLFDFGPQDLVIA